MRSYKLSQEEADRIERLLKGGDNSDIDSDDELVENEEVSDEDSFVMNLPNMYLSAPGRGFHQHAYSCFDM